jgi:hypothetical protein
MMGASTHSGVLPTTLNVVLVLEIVVLVVLVVVVLELVLVLVLEVVLEVVVLMILVGAGSWSASVQLDNRSEDTRICFSIISLSADG